MRALPILTARHLRHLLWLPLPILFTDHLYSLHLVRGQSMSPTLTPHQTSMRDLILCQRLFAQRRLRRGEVVLFRSPLDPEKVAVKRVVGIEGDVVRRRRWRLPLPLPAPGGAAAGPEPEREREWELARAGQGRLEQVPPGSVWVEGDEGFRSLDSNSYGPVPIALVTAKVKWVVWPLSRVGRVEVDEGIAAERRALAKKGPLETSAVYG